MNTFKNKKAIVTGGAGFIGSYVADALIKAGIRECWILDNLSTSGGGNIPSGAKFKNCDLSLDPLDEVVKKADFIFHLASIPRSQESVEHPLPCHDSNVTGTIRLLEACRLNTAKLCQFVYASSCAIYGPQKKIPIREDAPINHGTPYALQKWMGEEYVRLYATLYRLPTIALRYGNTYGTKRQSEKGGYPNVLAAFSRQKKELGRLLITGDGKQTRDFVHVFDVAKATLKAALSPFHDGRAFNISSGNGVSINKIAGFFKCPVKYIPARPGEARDIVLNNSTAKKQLGWRPTVDLTEGLQIYFGS